MSIQELKEKIANLPDDMRVYCSGFDESPIKEPAVLSIIDVVQYAPDVVDDEVVEPIHAEGEDWYKGGAHFKALVIDFQPADYGTPPL